MGENEKIKFELSRNTRELMREIFSRLKPPPAISISEWADRFRMISPEASAEPGRWRTSKAPYQKFMMDAISDPKTTKVVVMTAAQIGKTDALILNPTGYYIHNDPSPIMTMEPTLQMGEAYSKDRLSPMIRDTPVLSALINDKSRTSGNTILQKVFPGGHVTIVGANSPSSLASRPIRALFADEIDRYPFSAGNEGDPLLLAEKRLTTFWNKKIVYVSTPTIDGLSRIQIEFENSTKEEWNVPCPHCGKFQPLLWSQVQFDKADLTDINYVCVHCGAVCKEAEWKQQYIKGKFVAAFPARNVRGFHLNSLASLFVDWREVVEKFLEANKKAKEGNVELLKVWTNTEMGECWHEQGEQLAEDEMYKRREKYGCMVPKEVLVLTAGVDTQDNRFEIEVVGWGVEKESWGIQYQVIYGDLKQPHVWEQLSAFLEQEFEREDGQKLRIACTCMDSGGHFTTEVYRFCKKRYSQNVFAIKGYGGADVPYISRPTTSNRVKTPLFKIGVDTGKALLAQRLKVVEEGPNYCHFPRDRGRGYTEEYFRGLTAEQMVMKYVKGHAVITWELKNPSYHRNEPWDIRNYATAALEIANPVLIAPENRAARRRRTQRRTVSSGII